MLGELTGSDRHRAMFVVRGLRPFLTTRHASLRKALDRVTTGLPIIRTSVDHGTAFDSAGIGKADPQTMRAAYRAGAELAPYADRARTEYGAGA